MIHNTHAPAPARHPLTTALFVTLLAFFAPTHAHPGGSPESPPSAAPPQAHLSVVATTTFLADVTAAVAAGRADITTLIPAGKNPHAYQPTPRALVTLERADIVFVNGLGLEETLLDTVTSVATGPVVTVSDGIKTLTGHSHGDDVSHNDDHAQDNQDPPDPHVWFSPVNILVWITNIETALRAIDPAGAETYRANAAGYRAEIAELDRYIRRQVSTVPPHRRTLVMDHTTLNYFARDYGFTILGSVIPATTDQAEPSAKSVAALSDLLSHTDVPTIFIGNTAGDGLRSLISTVAKESGRDIRVQTLLTGSLAPKGNPGDTYLGFIRYNTTRIVEGLTR